MEKEDLLLEGMHCRWSTAMFRGEVDEALAASAVGMQRYDRAKHQWMGPIFGGHDPGVCAFAVQAINLTLRGRSAEALAAADRALELAGELNQPSSICHALQNMTFVVRLLGDDARLEQFANRMIELAERYNMPPQRAHAKFLIAWLRARRGEVDVDSMVQEFSKAIVMGPMYRYYAALLAEICVGSGHYDLALQTLEAAIASVAEPGVGFFVSELHRLKGVCLERRSPGDAAARRCIETAVQIARQQGATLLERDALRELESLAPPR
jgi:tetratricopeptide (TPR) repeat protein